MRCLKIMQNFTKSFVTSVTPLKCPRSSQPVLTEPFGVRICSIGKNRLVMSLVTVLRFKTATIFKTPIIVPRMPSRIIYIIMASRHA